MVYTTSGLAAAALTERAAQSSQMPSIPCFAGTRMRLNAMSISRVFRLLILIYRLSAKVGGPLEAGLYRSSLLLDQSSFPLRMVGSLVTNGH